jgi:tellurite resistance protein
MPNIFCTAKSALVEQLQRSQSKRFLKALMAASAFLALADDEVLLSERLAVDFILENTKDLKIFDAHKAVNLFRDYAEAIRDDVTAGKTKVLKTIAKFAGDERMAALIIRASVCIAKADGDISAEENEVIVELCQVLKIDTSELCHVVDMDASRLGV